MKREPRGAEGRCFICDEKGHKKIDCPDRRGGRDKRRRRDSDSKSPLKNDKRSRTRSPRKGGSRKYSSSRSESPNDRKKKSKIRSMTPKKGESKS